LDGGRILLLEGKGDPDERDDAKATAARRWVAAVNTWGGLGVWDHAICYDASTLANMLDDHAQTEVSALA
jgi:type III restriction enzyme